MDSYDADEAQRKAEELDATRETAEQVLDRIIGDIDSIEYVQDRPFVVSNGERVGSVTAYVQQRDDVSEEEVVAFEDLDYVTIGMMLQSRDV